jgi:nitrite reductase/ring-hydroxylating ferredoxin subunit
VKVVVAGGRSILIVHHGGRLFAIENRCSHAEQPIECGRVRYGWIACPAHGAKFDLETGDALTAPATTPIATFPIRVVGDRIEVAL